MICKACNGTREVRRDCTEFGMTVPCGACGGSGLQEYCAHAEVVPAFMPGSFYCKTCPAKLFMRDGILIEVLTKEEP